MHLRLQYIWLKQWGQKNDGSEHLHKNDLKPIAFSNKIKVTWDRAGNKVIGKKNANHEEKGNRIQKHHHLHSWMQIILKTKASIHSLHKSNIPIFTTSKYSQNISYMLILYSEGDGGFCFCFVFLQNPYWHILFPPLGSKNNWGTK